MFMDCMTLFPSSSSSSYDEIAFHAELTTSIFSLSSIGQTVKPTKKKKKPSAVKEEEEEVKNLFLFLLLVIST